MYKKILERVKKNKVIIIHRHYKPDGDALGSQMGLKEILKSTYPNKEIYAVGDSIAKYDFIGKMDIIEDVKYEDALVIILDTAERGLISDERYSKAAFKIKIDHHMFKEEYADLEIIGSEYESCARLVADIAKTLKWKLTKEAAKALFTGIVTDSGRFRYDSITTNTFSSTAWLLKWGFDTSEVYNNLYIDDIKTVRLRAHFALNFKMTKNNVAYMKNTADDLKRHDVDIFTMSRGMVNTMAGIRDIDIWANFSEDPDKGIIISELRSSKYNVNAIATKYGGGGHRLASGMSLSSWEDVEKVLEDLDNLIGDINGQ